MGCGCGGKATRKVVLGDRVVTTAVVAASTPTYEVLLASGNLATFDDGTTTTTSYIEARRTARAKGGRLRTK